MSTVSAPILHDSSTWGERVAAFRNAVDFDWSQDQFASDTDSEKNDGLSRRVLQGLEAKVNRKEVKAPKLKALAVAIDRAAELRNLPKEWVELWKVYIFKDGGCPPNLTQWREIERAAFGLEVTQETSKGQIRDHPPTVPELSDLEGVRSVFLELQRLIRENRRIRWSWNDFEQASAAETVEMLEQAGFPNWAQCWWDLVMSYERSQPAGFEVRQNLNITRGLWMKESLRRGLYGRAGEQTSQ